MDEKREDEKLTQWFSTYGTITAQRILERYHITLPSEELLYAIKSPLSFYHRIIQVPLKNVLNGIVLQQAHDYHVYAQKMFIDYLLSGESSKDQDSQGALTRESLEEERKKLVILGEEFNKRQREHNELIASSQATLIRIAHDWTKALDSGVNLISNTLKNNAQETKKSLIRQSINFALTHTEIPGLINSGTLHLFVDKMNEQINVILTPELKDKILDSLKDLIDITANFDKKVGVYMEKCMEMSEQARSFRAQFYETILRVTNLIKLLPDYKINSVQDIVNREPLYFDPTVGE
ncbi:MAG: hypothetical protein Q8M40_07865 [Legionella sp.]|nr:hypothetical protein [Legionella sp.]